MRQIILSILSFLSTLIAVNGQASSFSFKAENPKLSRHIEDSIFINNPLCQKYVEMAKLDTFWWERYPKIDVDSIFFLRENSANELFNQTLDFKSSDSYSNIPFNLFGTYYESEYKNDTNIFQNVKSKVMVYDSY